MTADPLPAAAVRLDGAVQRYRVVAIVTGIGLLILVFVGVPLQIAGSDAVAGPVGFLHGILYIVYVLLVFDLARRRRWSIVRTLLIAAAGTVPFAGLFAERHVVAQERAAGVGAPTVDGVPTP